MGKEDIVDGVKGDLDILFVMLYIQYGLEQRQNIKYPT